jgi:hypothetical protein
MTALTNAERQARYTARLKALAAGATPPPAPKRGRPIAGRPTDRLTRPQRWKNAIVELTRILDEYQTWRTNMPSSIDSTATAERLDELLELRDLVEQLQDARLPKGFGRD